MSRLVLRGEHAVVGEDADDLATCRQTQRPLASAAGWLFVIGDAVLLVPARCRHGLNDPSVSAALRRQADAHPFLFSGFGKGVRWRAGSSLRLGCISWSLGRAGFLLGLLRG